MQRGGDNNVAMTFGQGHTCGTAPERVPARMKAHVASMAQRYPQCFRAASVPGAPPAAPPPRPPPAPVVPVPVPSPPPRAVPVPSPSPPPPKPADAGTWANPIVVDKLPFLGAELSVSLAAAPAGAAGGSCCTPPTALRRMTRHRHRGASRLAPPVRADSCRRPTAAAPRRPPPATSSPPTARWRCTGERSWLEAGRKLPRNGLLRPQRHLLAPHALQRPARRHTLPAIRPCRTRNCPTPPTCSWFSGGLAGGNLTVSACANINPGGDAVVTVLSSPNAAGGPWACVGGDDGARRRAGPRAVGFGRPPGTLPSWLPLPRRNVPPMQRFTLACDPLGGPPRPCRHVRLCVQTAAACPAARSP